MENNQVEISKGIYQSYADWNVQVDIAEEIIRYFPTLSPDSIQVLSKAILNKLTQGVKYSEEMEKMISLVYPKVVEGLQQTSAERMKESKRKVIQASDVGSNGDLENDIEKYLDQNHLLNLPYKIAKEWIQMYGQNKFYDTLQSKITRKEISFPFIRYFEKEPSFFFKNLMKYEPKINHPNTLPVFCSNVLQPLSTNKFVGKNTVLETQKGDYRNMDLISDLFQEEVRLQALRKDQKMSSYEDWLKRGSDLIEELIYRKKDITPYNLREISHEMVKEATQFKPTVALSVYQMINVLKESKDQSNEKLRILDFSAGWGDRLIASLANQAKRYLATDPNENLKKGHLEMIRTLYPLAFPDRTLPKDPNQFPEDFKVIYEPFQTANIPLDEKFDLIFTSPPFFDFEMYSEHKGQSIQQFPKFDDWMKGFLFASLKKGWDLLDKEGYMVIHIKDMKEIKVCESMNLYIQGYLKGAKFLGVLGTKGSSDNILPMWVWEKTQHSDETLQKEAQKLMGKYYPQYIEDDKEDGVAKDKGTKDIIRETGYQQPKFGNTERNRERFGHLEKLIPQEKNVEVLLDIGAGNAELGAYFGKMLDTKKVYALDIYPEKDFVQPTQESNVIYKQMKDFIIPLPDQSVDMVMMMMFLHHVDEQGKMKVIKEIQRVLKPGGLVFIREHDVPSGDKKFEKYLDDVHAKFNPNPLEHSVEKTYYQSRSKLKDLFLKNHFIYLDESIYKDKNPQAIYHELYVLQ